MPLCALTCTCLDGVHPKDASNDALGFGGDYDFATFGYGGLGILSKIELLVNGERIFDLL
jgi:hypothetical protein